MRRKRIIRDLSAGVAILVMLFGAGCGRGDCGKPYCIWKIFELRDGKKAYRGVSDDWTLEILREGIDNFLPEGVDKGTRASNNSTAEGRVVAVRFPPQEQEQERRIVVPPDGKPLFPAHYYFANASLLWRLKGHHKLGLHDKAVPQSANPAETDLLDAAAYHERGAAHVEDGRYDRAISDYSKAIEMNAQYAEALYDRGVAYYRKGQHNLAIADYARAIEINPKLREQDNLFVQIVRKKWAMLRES